jgi:hypothetical protein
MSTHDVPHDTEVVVRGAGRGFVQEISARSHHLVADEPVSAGGTDTGRLRTTSCSPRLAVAHR